MKGYVVRNKNGKLELHIFKPLKQTEFWSSYAFISITDTDLPEGVNPQWTDDEPIEVELTIERTK